MKVSVSFVSLLHILELNLNVWHTSLSKLYIHFIVWENRFRIFLGERSRWDRFIGISSGRLPLIGISSGRLRLIGISSGRLRLIGMSSRSGRFRIGRRRQIRSHSSICSMLIKAIRFTQLGNKQAKAVWLCRSLIWWWGYWITNFTLFLSRNICIYTFTAEGDDSFSIIVSDYTSAEKEKFCVELSFSTEKIDELIFLSIQPIQCI